MKMSSLARCGFACLLPLVVATPAAAASERVEMKLECSATRPGWPEARVFTVSYIGGNKRLKDVAVTEKARVFTPTDQKSLYTTRGKKGWGVITTLPDKRDGKWTGKSEDEGDAFAMKAQDGRASFVLAPDPADDKRRLLTWQSDMELAKDEELSWEGAGTCRVISTEANVAPAPEAAASPAPKADEAPALKTPRKEIRLFGGRKSTPPEGEISK
jgi:hypothetical protein